MIVVGVHIRECGNTLYLGLTGIVRNLIQKSTGMDTPFISILSSRMSRASDNSKDVMK